MLTVRDTVEEHPKMGVWRRSSPVNCGKSEKLGEKSKTRKKRENQEESKQSKL